LLCGQTKDTWIAFWNPDTTLVGYKDQQGVVKIKPQFAGSFAAAYFDEIMAVSDDQTGSLKTYYLTKAGRKIGQDSLHIFDNTPDCENEGFIRFRDRSTGFAGLFNRNGDMVIPAVYNEVSKVRNGLVVVLKGAQKQQEAGEEHFTYSGGQTILIDTNNKIILDSITAEDNLNLYSMQVSSKPAAASIRQNFRGKDGRYYSFVDFDLEFKEWLKTNLLSNLTKAGLQKVVYDEVSYWNEAAGWMTVAGNAFMERNYQLLKSKLLPLNAKSADYDIMTEGLNPFIFNAPRYQKYFNNCGESLDWIYPMKNIIISYNDLSGMVQDHFEFLRTEHGYKLISVTMPNGELK
jgi:hypothetical protein